MTMFRALAALAALLLAGHAVAAPRTLPAPPETVMQAGDEVVLFPKTLMYAGIASLFDISIGYLVGGGIGTGSAVAAIGSGTGWLLYHFHERTWAEAAPDAPAEASLPARLTTFTGANVVRLFGLGLLGTQGAVWSGTFLAINAIGDAAAYVITDRLWQLGTAKFWMTSQP